MKTTLAWVITLVWVALYGRKLTDPSFPVPAEVTPVMLLAAGYLFGKDVKEKLRARVNKALDEPDQPDEGEATGVDPPRPAARRGKRNLPRAKGR